jgi:hypothetical protein
MSSLLGISLSATVSVALLIALTSPMYAADCGAYVSQCLRSGKPDAQTKCAAAGQNCAKTGVWVGPYTGQSYQVRKCGAYNRSQACY